MVKFILTVPNRLRSAVLEQMLAWRDQAAGDDVGIRIVERREPQRASIHAEEATADAGEPEHVPEINQVPESAPAPVMDRSTKVYRVIDTAAYVGPVPHQIRMFLIDHPNSTAKQIEEATGRGKKSVESAIWGLRDKGIVKESNRESHT